MQARIGQAQQLLQQGVTLARQQGVALARQAVPANKTGCACRDAKGEVWRYVAENEKSFQSSELLGKVNAWRATRQRCIPERIGLARDEAQSLRSSFKPGALTMREWGHVGVRAFEVYAFFTIGEVIGRGTIIGYKP